MLIQACNNSALAREEELEYEVMFENITSLGLLNVEWDFQNVPPEVERVYLTNVTIKGEFGKCSRLIYLYLAKSMNFSMLSPDWLKKCSQLKELKLRLAVSEIRLVVENAPQVQDLYLSGIKNMSDILHTPLISLSRGSGPFIRKIRVAYEYEHTNDLNVIWDDVFAELLHQLSQLPHLEDLFIFDPRFDFCAEGKYPSVTFRSLKYLSIKRSNMTRMCFKKTRVLPKLEKLDIDNFHYTDLYVQFSELSALPSPQHVNFWHNQPKTTFVFNRDDYLALSDPLKIFKMDMTLEFLNAHLDCSCENTIWFTRALKTGMVTANSVDCMNQSRPIDLQCEQLDCDRVSCNSTCLCCSDGKDGIIADCRYMDTKLQEIPTDVLSLSNLTQLFASNNDILTLPSRFPDSLVLLNLGGNNIWNAGAGKVATLFSNPQRRVRLYRNTILCNCDNKQMLQTLQNHREQVDDFEQLSCSLDNLKIGEVLTEELCADSDHQKSVTTAMSVAFVSAAFAALIVIFYYRWRREIKLYFFSHGWCMSYLREENLDEDRRYDVFLSFCHEDTEVVMEHLLPVLDKDYAVCVHHRDWCPGEMIPTQIATSVKQSRRTIVILSRQFLHSLWGRLEFQTAHVSALSESRVRVVLIVMDDVLERDEIGAELLAYVRLNTYLRWTDPWFWQKLRYALPHQPLLQKGSIAVHENSINVTSELPQLNNLPNLFKYQNM